jgi:hypothetical protein
MHSDFKANKTKAKNRLNKIYLIMTIIIYLYLLIDIANKLK